MDLRTPKQILDEMVDSARKQNGTLSDLKVPTEFYRELVRECAPKTVEETYGFPVSVDPSLDEEGHEGLDYQAVPLH